MSKQDLDEAMSNLPEHVQTLINAIEAFELKNSDKEGIILLFAYGNNDLSSGPFLARIEGPSNMNMQQMAVLKSKIVDAEEHMNKQIINAHLKKMNMKIVDAIVEACNTPEEKIIITKILHNLALNKLKAPKEDALNKETTKDPDLKNFNDFLKNINDNFGKA